MDWPLLVTKLYTPPLRPNCISRMHLISMLEDGWRKGRRLTLVSAQAGYGKTTLVTEWLRRAGEDNNISRAGMPPRKIAWLSLDEDDNEPARFLDYLCASLETAQVSIDQEIREMFHTRQSPAIKVFLTHLINRLADHSGNIILVLDDYHSITQPQIHEALAYLLDHIPPQFHMVIISRIDPPLPLAKARVRNQLTELHARDLRFSAAEAAVFLNQVMGLELTPESIEVLDERTEGWIAALQLAALSMQGQQDIAGFINSISQSTAFVLDYLVEEVMRKQPLGIRAFLLQTSILERLTPELCDAVTGELIHLLSDSFPDCRLPAGKTLQSRDILAYLENANLFIIPLDEQHAWYRYHHLFAGVLRSRLLDNPAADLAEYLPETRQLHLRAADWFEKNGLAGEAVEHFLKAGDYSRAIPLLEEAAKTFLMSNEIILLQRWLSQMPEKLILERPRLCILQAWSHMFKLQLDKTESYLRAAEEGLANSGDTEITSLKAEILALHSMATVFQGNFHAAAEYARQALAASAEDDASLRGIIAFDNAFSPMLQGNARAAVEFFTEAAALGKKGGNIFIAAMALWQLAEQQLCLGHLRQATTIYEDAIRWLSEQNPALAAINGLIYDGYGGILLELNRLEEAAGFLSRGIELCRKWNEIMAFDGYAILSRVRLAQGDLDAALKLINLIENSAHQAEFVTMGELPVRTIFVRLWLAQGNMAAATQWAETCSLDADAGWDRFAYPYLAKETICLVLVRVLLACKKIKPALALLHRLEPEAASMERNTAMIEIHILEALAAKTQGNIRESLVALEKALALAEPEGFIRLFIDEGAPMAELLRLAVEEGISAEYAGFLLAEYEPDKRTKAPRAMENLLMPSVPSDTGEAQAEILSERERQVLKLVAEGYSNQEIAAALVIAVSTVKTHINNIFSKLEVRSRTQAASRARELELI